MTVINHNSITALLVILATCHTQGFFLDGDRVESRSTNLTQNTILGLFDTVTGLTHGIGGIFDQFEQGFESIRPRNQTVLEKDYVSEEEGSGSSVSDEEHDSSLGSKAVVGLFDSLRNLNRNVGKLVDIVGDTLSERREDIADIATNVDTRVSNFGHGLRKNFGFHMKRKTKKESEEKTEDDLEKDDTEEAVITENTEIEV